MADTTTTTKTGSEAANNANNQTAPKPKAGTKDAGIVESVVATAKRYIPGLGEDKGSAAAGKSRARSGKKKQSNTQSADIANAEDPALATALVDHAPSSAELPDSLLDHGNTAPSKRPAPLTTGNGNGAGNELTNEELAALEQKRFSPTAILQKRLKANSKKLQRIATYEEQSAALNEDQKKALATKPALEALTKEHKELIKLFEDEEAEDDKLTAKKNKYQEKQVQLRIQQALSANEAHVQNDLTFLLQFLHLYSLFNTSQSGFAPPTLPPVVANATGQQHAAVQTLFHSLADGPLFGGVSAASAGSHDNGDAVSQIKALNSGSSNSIIEGVSFADIKQMILDLTAPPSEVPGGHELPESDVPSASHVDSTSQPPLAAADAPALNFMQASEIEPDRSANNEDAMAAAAAAKDKPEHQAAIETVSRAATPGFGSQTPILEKSVAQAEHPSVNHAPQKTQGWEEPAGLTQDKLPAKDGWESMTSTEPIKSWADEVEEATPSNPYTATAEVPTEVQSGETGNALAGALPNGGRRGDGRGRGRGGRGRGGEFRGHSDGQNFRGRGGPHRGGGGRDMENGGTWRRGGASEHHDGSREAIGAAVARVAEANGPAAGTTVADDGFTQVAGRHSGGHSRGRGDHHHHRGGRGQFRGDFRGGERRGGEQHPGGSRGSARPPRNPEAQAAASPSA